MNGAWGSSLHRRYDAAPADRGVVLGRAELLDVVEPHVEADEIAVEGQRAVHVADADGHVGDAVYGHRVSVFLDLGLGSAVDRLERRS